jgi:hypothetical protein
MSAPAPAVPPELKALMRRLKLGQALDTLPERAALARQHELGHLEFLEQLFSDEVQRRESTSAAVRARAAHLDPTMVLEAWDETADVTYDKAVWAELVSLRFVEQAQDLLVLGPHRVDVLARRHVGPVGRAAPGGLARPELHELAPVEELDGARVGTGFQALAHQGVGHAVNGSPHLAMEISVHFGVGPLRDVEGLAWPGEQMRLLLGQEHLERPEAGGAVHPHAGSPGAPGQSAGPHVFYVAKVLTREEVLPYIWHGSLNFWLVRWLSYAGRVYGEASGYLFSAFRGTLM